MNNWAWLPEAGQAAAVLIVVFWFLRQLKEERKMFVDVITNHLNHSTEAMQKLELAIRELCGKINGMQ